MLGGIIGDLAASTYLREPRVFCKQLFDEKASLSEYGLSIFATVSSPRVIEKTKQLGQECMGVL